jgi:hypothetical protein
MCELMAAATRRGQDLPHTSALDADWYESYGKPREYSRAKIRRARFGLNTALSLSNRLMDAKLTFRPIGKITFLQQGLNPMHSSSVQFVFSVQNSVEMSSLTLFGIIFPTMKQNFVRGQ